jgi:hypothetical protein
MYAYVSLVQASTGVALHVATNLTPFLSLAAVGGAFGTLLVRSGALRRATDARGLLELFLGVGFVVTTWRFWFDLLRYNSDSAFPLLGSLFVLIWACLEPPPLHGAAMLASLALVALAPLYAPFLIVAVACLPGSSGWTPPTRGESAWVLRLAAACSVLGLGVYLLPRALAGWKGYQPSASSWLFRSGLDGDTTYFTSILQAFVKPCSVNCCGGRAMLDVVFPAFGLTLGLAGQPAVRRRLLQGLIWLAAPYGFSLVLLPQAVSIHPYLYDHLLIVPFVILGAWSLLLPAVRERLRGVAFLAYLVVMIGLIMSNLVKLAFRRSTLSRSGAWTSGIASRTVPPLRMSKASMRTDRPVPTMSLAGSKVIAFLSFRTHSAGPCRSTRPGASTTACVTGSISHLISPTRAGDRAVPSSRA